MTQPTDPASQSAATSVVIPAFNEARAIGEVVTALRAAAPWHEILVVDDGSTDETRAQARSAGARVIRHPYNKGNGAAVKTGIRAVPRAHRVERTIRISSMSDGRFP